MVVFKYIMIALIFICLIAGFALIFGARMFISNKKNTDEVAHRKELKLKLVGYVLLMVAIAFAFFQSLIQI